MSNFVVSHEIIRCQIGSIRADSQFESNRNLDLPITGHLSLPHSPSACVYWRPQLLRTQLPWWHVTQVGRRRACARNTGLLWQIDDKLAPAIVTRRCGLPHDGPLTSNVIRLVPSTCPSLLY